MEYGIAVFDIDLDPSTEPTNGDQVTLIALHGPYASKQEAEDFKPAIEDKYRSIYASRYAEGRYEFKVTIRAMDSNPPLDAGYL